MTTIRASHAHLRLEAGTYMGFNRTTLGYAATMIFSGHFILNLSGLFIPPSLRPPRY